MSDNKQHEVDQLTQDTDEMQLVVVVQYHDKNSDLNVNFRDKGGGLHLSLTADMKRGVLSAHTADLAAVLSGLVAAMMQKTETNGDVAENVAEDHIAGDVAEASGDVAENAADGAAEGAPDA